MEGLEHQVVSTGGHSPPVYSAKPIYEKDRIIPKIAPGRDATPKLTDSARPNPTESKDNQFRDARVRQLDEASLLKPMKWHRLYFNQGRECGKAGNRFVVDVPDFIGINMDINLEMIVCVPFQTHCHSAACRHKREVC